MCVRLFATVMILQLILTAYIKAQGAKKNYTECNYDNPVQVTSKFEEQHILSPNYPNEYGTKEQCRWEINTQDPNLVITFLMIDYEIVPSATCNEDFVELKDGISTSSRTLKTWCGSMNPQKPEGSFASTTQDARLTFKTNKETNAKGFKLAFWNVPKREVEYIPVEYKAINYILHIVFAAIVSSLLCTAIGILIKRKYFNRPVEEIPIENKRIHTKEQLQNNNIHIVNESSPIKQTNSLSSINTSSSRNRLIGSTQTLTTPV